jgi:hypothetical protein
MFLNACSNRGVPTFRSSPGGACASRCRVQDTRGACASRGHDANIVRDYVGVCAIAGPTGPSRRGWLQPLRLGCARTSSLWAAKGCAPIASSARDKA